MSQPQPPTINAKESSSLEITDTGNTFPFDTSDLIFAVFCLVFFGLIFWCNKRWSAPTQTNDNDSHNDDIEAAAGFARKLARMDTKNRMAVYNEAFDRNQNQTVLIESQIVTADSNSYSSDKDSNTRDSNTTVSTVENGVFDAIDYNDDTNNDVSVYLALEKVRENRRRRSSLLGTSVPFGNGEVDESHQSSNSGQRKRRNSSIVHPRHNTNSNPLVRGNCAICFEDMVTNDQVVWSEKPTCPHVYHKECMVAFLAHRRAQEITNSNACPCPTCRQDFVTVCCEDVVKVKIAAGSTTPSSMDDDVIERLRAAGF